MIFRFLLALSVIAMSPAIGLAQAPPIIRPAPPSYPVPPPIPRAPPAVAPTPSEPAWPPRMMIKPLTPPDVSHFDNYPAASRRNE